MSLVMKWIILATISVVFGNISYEVFLGALGDHFYKFADQNQTILDGHAVQYVFQQRMLPSYEINVLERLFKIDNMSANLVLYRNLFVLSSLLATFMSVIVGVGVRRAIILTAIFSASNVFIIVAGYWLMAFDLQNLVCVQLLFIIFFIHLNVFVRIAMLCVLGLIWQFTLEEVIYIPIFWLLYNNASNLHALRIKEIISSVTNWLIATTIPVSLVLTNLTRKWFLVGADVRGSNTQVMAQDLQTATNLSTMFKQLTVIFHPVRTLRTDYWMQGVGLYLALNVCAICLIASLSATLKDPMKLAVLLMFVCMSSVSFLFAHLEETNTMMPLLVNLMAIYLSQNSFRNGGMAEVDPPGRRANWSLQSHPEPERAVTNSI